MFGQNYHGDNTHKISLFSRERGREGSDERNKEMLQLA